MTKLFSVLCAALRAEKPAVTAMVIRCAGSTPRAPGATMLLTAEAAETLGTVGGGQAEYFAAQRAAALLCPQAPRWCLETYECLSAAELAHMGKESGGEVTILFLRWPPEALPLAEAICKALPLNADASLSITYEENFWQGEVIPCCQTRSEPCRFTLKLAEAGLCYLFGGGHVSRALVPLLSHLNFPCVVLDERPDYANEQCFPTAVATHCGPLPEFAAGISFVPGDCALIMTRGHQGDYEVLTALLRSPVWYLGMVGSRRKMEATFRRLREEGFTEEQLARIITPIGLAIEAETPDEMAVSIAAQLIQLRAARRHSAEKELLP